MFISRPPFAAARVTRSRSVCASLILSSSKQISSAKSRSVITISSRAMPRGWFSVASSNAQSITRLNKNGARIEPCLTPETMANGLDSEL